MAFRTNLVPTIEERTVSGSSVSFNSAFALPLKACKVSFSATQSGSGTPSPSNPRAISGVSAIGLNANSTPVSVSLGDTRYGGELDVLTGELTLTKKIVDLSTITGWIYNATYDRFYSSQRITDYDAVQKSADMAIFENVITSNDSALPSAFVDNFNRIFIRNTGYTEVEPFVENIINGHYAVVTMKPQIIQLSANELSSIIGNNTFSTDTGTLEITFADLQEKSASGSVASFNTALAMPLPSCNIAVNAWQEGSGDPSPSNVRPIHGFSEVNATRAGKNLFGIPKSEFLNGVIIGSASFVKVNIPYNARYVISTNAPTGFVWVGVSGDTSPSTNYRIYEGNPYTFHGNATLWIGLNIKKLDEAYNYLTQIEVGSTPTSYESYTGNIYTIQLGQEVYGAEVDAVNGVAHCTHVINKIKDMNVAYYAPSSSYPLGFFIARGTPVKKPNITNVKASCFRTGYSWSTDNSIFGNGANDYCYIVCSSYSDVNSFKTALGENEVLYELAEPFDIQLTPTQIETLIGNNTIFADTGDVDLTYKDLDIAKRGNFREVFRLPS